MKRLRYLCLDFPNWPIQRAQVASPQLRQGGLVLYQQQGRRGAQVVAVCAQGRRMGIEPGMPLAEALALRHARKTGSAGRDALRIQPHDPRADRLVLEHLAAQAHRFTPWVGYDATNLPHSLFLQIQGTAALWGGERELVGQVVGWVEQAGYEVRAAVADSPSAAWAIAHWGEAEGSPCLVNSSQLGQILAELPIEALRAAEDAEDRMRRLGLRQLGQLREMPRSALAARFGQDVLRRLDQLAGRQPELIPACQPPVTYQVQEDLEHPVPDHTRLMVVLKRLLEQLASDLQARDEGAVLLECHLACADAGPITFQVGLYRPTADPAVWGKLVALRLEPLRLAGPVRRIRVQALLTARLSGRQGGLLEPRPGDERAWAALVNQLSNRLGADRVVRPRWCGGILPERACRWEPLTGQVNGSASGGSPARNPPPPRPLWLLPEPKPIEVLAAVPDGPPACLWIGRNQHAIGRVWGPERLETGWWRGASQQRDYYRVELEDGRHWWIFRKRDSGTWFVHGYFG